MLYLLGQIIFFLLITAILWFAIGWSLRSLTTKTERRSLEADWTNRFNSMKRDRDLYRNELERMRAAPQNAPAGRDDANQPLAQRASALREENQASAQMVGQLSARLEELQTTAAKRERDFEALSERLEAAIAAIRERDERLSTLSNGGDPSAAQLQTAMVQLREREEKIARLQHEIANPPAHGGADQIRIESHLRAALAKVKERDEHIARLNQANLETAASHKQEEFDALITEFDRARETIDKQAEQLAALRLQRDAHPDPHDELAKYRDVISEQEKTIAELNTKLRKQDAPQVQPGRYAQRPASGDLFGEPPAFLLDQPRGGKDNLKEIHGIGPVLEQTLNRLGIFHFTQIAGLTPTDIAWLAANINSFPDRILRDRWVDQADELARRSSDA